MTPRHPHNRRRGVAAMLAMLFLVLFGILALGFYSTVTTSQQVAASEQRSVQALAAAESGMELLRYYLALVRVRGDATGSAMMTELFNDLGPLMNGSPNLGGVAVSKSGDTIFIPGGGTASVALGSTTRFRAKIWLSPDASNRQILVDVTGSHGDEDDRIRRTIRFAYNQSDHVSPVFTYALATQGGMAVRSGGVTAPLDPTLADVISTSTANPAITISGGSIGGSVAVTTAKSAINYVSGSVNGSSNATTIMTNHAYVVQAPPFPAIDTAPFKQFATSTYPASSGSTYRNVRIPANTNPKFTGNAAIEGIMYIESPNQVELQGNVTVKGLIVFENAGTDAVNSIQFKSGKLQQEFPPGAEFEAMRKMTGIGLLAPTANVVMAGSSTATLLGSVITSKFTYTGSADILMDKGTLVTLSPASDSLVLNGKVVTFNGIGALSPPSTVVRGEQSYAPVPGSYVEVPQ